MGFRYNLSWVDRLRFELFLSDHRVIGWLADDQETRGRVMASETDRVMVFHLDHLSYHCIFILQPAHPRWSQLLVHPLVVAVIICPLALSPVPLTRHTRHTRLIPPPVLDRVIGEIYMPPGLVKASGQWPVAGAKRKRSIRNTQAKAPTSQRKF